MSSRVRNCLPTRSGLARPCHECPVYTYSFLSGEPNPCSFYAPKWVTLLTSYDPTRLSKIPFFATSTSMFPSFFPSFSHRFPIIFSSVSIMFPSFSHHFLQRCPTFAPAGEAKLVAKAVRKLGLALCERDRPQEAARCASEAVVFCKKVPGGSVGTIIFLG